MNQKTKRTYTILAIVLVFALAVAALPQKAFAATAPACKAIYVVRSGDTLEKIDKMYGVRLDDTIAANKKLQAPYYTIYVKQRLCIPSQSKLETKAFPAYAKKPAADFSGFTAKGVLNIQTSNFPEKSFYYVKVDNAQVEGKSWYKVGYMRTNKGGTLKVTYSLPPELAKAGILDVCLKNAVTDAVICRRVFKY